MLPIRKLIVGEFSAALASSLVDHYAAKKVKSSPGQQEFKWVTIGADTGADGEKHGGHPVMIDKEGKMQTGKFAGQTFGEAFGKDKKDDKRDSSGNQGKTPPADQLPGGKSDDDTSDSSPLYEVDGPENTVARVFKHEKGFAVSLLDKDSGQNLSEIKIFPTLEQAKAHADTNRDPEQSKGETAQDSQPVEPPAKPSKKPFVYPNGQTQQFDDGGKVKNDDEAKPAAPQDEPKSEPPSAAKPESESASLDTPVTPAEKAGNLFGEAIERGDSPREAAAVAQKALDEDYEFARASKIRNAGEDLKGSARHILNMWKGLADAEKNGTAEKMVTRDQLLKNEPPDLMTHASKHPLSSLAMHYAMKAFPAKPGTKKQDNATKDRQQFLEAYQEVKAKSEELAQSYENPIDAIQALQKHVASMIQKFRGQTVPGRYGHTSATDKYNQTANDLVGLYESLALRIYQPKKTSVQGKLGEFADTAKKVYGEGWLEDEAASEAVSGHAMDVMEGKSLNVTFNQEKKQTNRFSTADLYVKHATRKGGRDLTAITKDPNKATNHLVESFGVRGVQWGNSVTDDERQHHAEKTVEALTDLADVLGIHPKDVALNGKLGLAIGARGKGNASAHYEPLSQVINLTRASGVGALAHEWGHAFDHMLNDFGATMMSNDNDSTHYLVQPNGRKSPATANTRVPPGWSLEEQPKAALKRAFQQLKKASEGFRTRLRKQLQDDLNSGKVASGKANNYWNSDHEIFARTFERHVQHKLRKDGRDNTYLSGFTQHPYWPTEEESAAMSDAFDNIFREYRVDKYGNEEVVKFSRRAAMAIIAGEMFTDAIIDRYAKLKSSPGQQEFKWITIGSEAGADGQKHGGHPVMIDKDGVMQTGKFAGQSMKEAFGKDKKESAPENQQDKQAEKKPNVPPVGTVVHSKHRPSHTINENLHSHLTGEKKAVLATPDDIAAIEAHENSQADNKILSHLAGAKDRQNIYDLAKATGLQAWPKNSRNPLTYPLNAALKRLVDTGKIKANMPQWGEPTFEAMKSEEKPAGQPGQPPGGSQEPQNAGSKPLTGYGKYLADGGDPAKWDEYRESQNQLSRERTFKAKLSKWSSGEKLQGNDIANALRAQGVAIPDSLKGRLQHDDTTVSLTSATGRGMSRSEGAAIHKWVSEQMNAIAQKNKSSQQPIESTSPSQPPGGESAAPQDQNLSIQQQDEQESWDNFHAVVANPIEARSRNLHRAINHAKQLQASFDRKLQRGEVTKEKRDAMNQSLDGEISIFASELKHRGDYAGGGPYSDESGFDSAGIAIPKSQGGQKQAASDSRSEPANPQARQQAIQSGLNAVLRVPHVTTPAQAEMQAYESWARLSDKQRAQFSGYKQFAGEVAKAFDTHRKQPFAQSPAAQAPTAPQPAAQAPSQPAAQPAAQPTPAVKPTPAAPKPQTIQQADERINAGRMRSEMFQQQADEERQRKQQEKINQWRKAYVGSPRENNAAGDLSRHDWEKALQNGVAPQRLAEIVDHGVASGVIDAKVGEHLKSKVMSSGAASQPRTPSPGIVMPTRDIANDQAAAGDQLGLFGTGEKARKSTPEQLFGDDGRKAKQGMMWTGLKDAAGQLDMFEEAENQKKQLFSAAANPLAEIVGRLMTDAMVDRYAGKQQFALNFDDDSASPKLAEESDFLKKKHPFRPTRKGSKTPGAVIGANKHLKVRGFTDAVTKCERCGREDLKGTVCIESLDGDGNGTGDFHYYGTDCASKVAGHRSSKTLEQLAVEATHENKVFETRRKNWLKEMPNKEKRVANSNYNKTNRKSEGSYLAQKGDLYVRIDSTDPDHVETFENEGFKRITPNVGDMTPEYHKMSDDEKKAFVKNKYAAMIHQEVARYVADSTGEKWVTIGGRNKDGKRHAGGHAVKINADGMILGGNVPKSWQGNHITEAHKTPASSLVGNQRMKNRLDQAGLSIADLNQRLGTKFDPENPTQGSDPHAAERKPLDEAAERDKAGGTPMAWEQTSNNRIRNRLKDMTLEQFNRAMGLTFKPIEPKPEPKPESTPEPEAQPLVDDSIADSDIAGDDTSFDPTSFDPSSFDEPVAKPTKPKKQKPDAVDRRIAEYFGDNPKLAEYVRPIVDEAYQDLVREAEEYNSAMREIISAAGVKSQNTGLFVGQFTKGKDYSQIRGFDLAVQFAQRKHPWIAGSVAGGESDKGDDFESDLARAISDGFRPLPTKTSDEVFRRAAQLTGDLSAFDDPDFDPNYVYEGSSEPFSARLRAAIDRYSSTRYSSRKNSSENRSSHFPALAYLHHLFTQAAAQN